MASLHQQAGPALSLQGLAGIHNLLRGALTITVGAPRFSLGKNLAELELDL